MRTSGPEDLVPHGCMGSIYRSVPGWLSKPLTVGEERPLLQTEMKKARLLEDLAMRGLQDLATQSFHSRHSGCSALVDLDFNVKVLSARRRNAASIHSQALMTAFEHVIPLLVDAPIAALISLRKSEGQAFAVYRDALSRAIVAAGNESPGDLIELFQDTVQPELNRIDKAVDDFRRSLRGTAIKSTAIAGVALTVGLFSGILPSAVGALIASFGCTRGLYDAVKHGLDALGDKPARSSDYYYLWKARSLASGSSSSSPQRRLPVLRAKLASANESPVTAKPKRILAKADNRKRVKARVRVGIKSRAGSKKNSASQRRG